MLAFLKNLFNPENRDKKIEQVLRASAVVLDVRTNSEFQSNHFPASKNIPLNEIVQKMEAIRKWNKPVITVCHSGNRSRLASTMLRSAGIEVYDGGAWSNLKKIDKV